METANAILQRRSVREFLPDAVPGALLYRLVDHSRLYASGGNLQPVRFAIVSQEPASRQIFDCLRWAMYLPDYQVSTQPPAFIILLRDSTVSKSCQFDIGAAATTLMLLAKANGLDTCCLQSFSSKVLTQALSLDEALVPELVIAVGYAKQENRTEPYTGSAKYRLDEKGNFVVPKRATEDVLVYTDL